jgi:hypothetical protein
MAYLKEQCICIMIYFILGKCELGTHEMSKTVFSDILMQRTWTFEVPPPPRCAETSFEGCEHVVILPHVTTHMKMWRKFAKQCMMTNAVPFCNVWESKSARNVLNDGGTRTAELVQQFLAVDKMAVVHHPPDLAPYNFFLFSRIKLPF